VWVANAGDNTVSEIDAGSGAVVGSPIPVGTAPNAIYADGEYVWVLSSTDGAVTQIDANSAAVINSPITVGTSPSAITSDGTDVWISNEGDNTVSEISIPRPIVIDPFPHPIFLTAAQKSKTLAFTGANIEAELAGAMLLLVAGSSVLLIRRRVARRQP
jgi:DNA-binding beta-propeller fold protein YncE